MQHDNSALAARIERDPEFQDLVRRRSRLAWSLSLIMAAIYFGFILLVAFRPDLLGTPIGSGVTSLGIPVGLGIIFAAFVLTGIYVRAANVDFDPTMEAIVERLK